MLTLRCAIYDESQQNAGVRRARRTPPNDGSLEVQTRTLIRWALLADVTGLFGHSVLTGAALRDGREPRGGAGGLTAFIKTASLELITCKGRVKEGAVTARIALKRGKINRRLPSLVLAHRHSEKRY